MITEMTMIHVMLHSNVHTPVLSKCIHILTRLREYCSFANMSGSFLMTHYDQKCVRKEIPRPSFLYLSR